MRSSRRLPLGSPTRKERSEDASNTVRGNNNNNEARSRSRQAPGSRRESSDKLSSKRSRRTNRGLPLSSRATAASSPATTTATALKTPPDVPSVSQAEKLSKDDIPMATAIAVKDAPHDDSSEEKEKTVSHARVASPASGAAAVPSKKRASSPKPKDDNNDHHHHHRKTELVMVDPNGSEVKIKLIVNHKPFSFSSTTRPKPGDAPSPKPSSRKGFLGNDGNQFNCEVCGEFGDVVCCDGCPKVFHRDCIPLSHSSRDSIDNDNEPWFCPSCAEEQRKGASGGGGEAKASGSSSTRVMTRRSSMLTDPAVSGAAAAKTTGLVDEEVQHRCDACGKTTDMPYYNETGNTLCAECFAAENDSGLQEEDDGEAAEEQEEEEAVAPSKRSERKRKASLLLGDDEKEKAPLKKKKRKKKDRKESMDHQPPLEPAFELPALPIPKAGIAQATPAFYFYLVENRVKIERVLARKHRSFTRSMKSNEKNALVAKEAALWWSRLRPADQKRFMNMSMRDYEGRIIEWKEDKSIREMNSAGNMTPATELAAGTEQRLLEEDEKLTWKRHQRLYLSTSVGSKPFKPEPDQAYNRVLQDLLHDMRFHPMPMLGIDRPTQEEEAKDETGTKVLIPYFDVHGPSSTSLGDACMGCMRSWNHFCPVLQRRVPAVEHRAKLQPPMSSLLATRVGLGLRPRLEEVAKPTDDPVAADTDAEPELGVWRKSDERVEMMGMKILPSCTLTTPNERMDDIVMFVEETTAMKVPEPSRPEEGSSKATASQLRSLPTQNQKSDDGLFKKCGRCRAIIQGDTGCVQCRRAQLVINMAKRQKQDGKLLRVHTSMLGRYNTKEACDTQSKEDTDVASAMLKERWIPSAVLPPDVKYAPNLTATAPARPKEQATQEAPAGETNVARRDLEWSTHNNSDSADEQQGKETGRSSRPSRAAAATHDVFEPHERQEIMERNRKSVNAFQKRLISTACAGILHALARRDPLKLFDQPVSDDAYYDVIKHPIFFCDMREKILNSQYPSLGNFANDVRQLCDNALNYNVSGSIYAKTASELLDLFWIMHKRAGHWVTALKDAYANHLNNKMVSTEYNDEDSDEIFAELQEDWPEAYRLLKSADWLKNHAGSDFLRTEENELAFYGSLAVSRVSVAAEASLAPYTDLGGSFGVVTKRTHLEDAELRGRVDQSAACVVGPLNLSTPSTWREESVHRLLRKVQSRRLDRHTSSEQGCARCDGLIVDQDVKLNMKADAAVGKVRKNEDSDLPRVDGSRIDLTTGRASANARVAIGKRRKESPEEQFESVMDSCVSVRGSRIHGLGLFADQEFKKGDAVAEYVGEYISNDEFETREAIYRENRTQDYSFRINSELVLDATRQGGPGRYANHDCNPNCASKIISGPGPKSHLKRVMIVALRTIKINEEITYDYQFPLEQDLSARIPCNCRSDGCRGFMNWDLPEKGSNNRAVLVQKRGANMRDRIRRLNRPLKRDEL